MAMVCSVCGREVTALGKCPVCQAAPISSSRLLAQRQAELNEKWRRRTGNTIGTGQEAAGASFVSTVPLPEPIHALSSQIVYPGTAASLGAVPEVGKVRFSGETYFAGMVANHFKVRELVEQVRIPDAEQVRRRLRARSLMLTEAMAPRLHQIASMQLRQFGINEPFEIYQAAGPENAAMHFVSSPVTLEINGQVLARTDESMLSALVGHELGHYLAHGASNPLRDVSLAAHVMLSESDGMSPEAMFAATRFSMAQELTADRFGMLGARDLHGCLRLSMTLVSGISNEAIFLDTGGYLAQARELMEQTLEDDKLALGSSHPEHSLRAYAQWLFGETDVFLKMTGVGPGNRTLEEVDMQLMALLGQRKIRMKVAPDSQVSRLLEEGPVGKNWRSYLTSAS